MLTGILYSCKNNMYNKDYDMRNIDKKILDNKMVSFYILPNEIRHIKL